MEFAAQTGISNVSQTLTSKLSLSKEVEIRTFKKIDKRKEFRGVLTAYDDKTVTIIEDNDEELKLDRKDIALIHLAFDF